MNNQPYFGTPQNGTQSWYNPNDFGMNTNVCKVTSLDEAIMRSNMCPSEMVYFNQSKNEFYNVRVDVNGNKSWQTFVYTVQGTKETQQISREEFDALAAKVSALESKPKEVIENAKSDGQHAVQ